MKAGNLGRHTSSIKLLLTDSNKVDRVRFAVSFVRTDTQGYPFQLHYDAVHIDEKWLYLLK